MTIKSPHTEMLPKRTWQELVTTSNGCGGIVDESLPQGVETALRGSVDESSMPAVLLFLGRRLGRYRGMKESSDAMPSRVDELRLASEAMDAIEQVRHRLANLPTRIDCEVELACWKGRKEPFFDFSQRLGDDLRIAWALLASAERIVSDRSERPGASKSLRDHFLADVASYLQRNASLGKEAAAGLAAEVLRAAGVDAPSDPRKARNIVRKVEAQK
ncbi:MAG TPA: hypothetical protein VFJ15_14935 [Oleiagrimonas sp.]|nr:hypothetical protein [Oleiagrimonas sp.]